MPTDEQAGAAVLAIEGKTNKRPPWRAVSKVQCLLIAALLLALAVLALVDRHRRRLLHHDFLDPLGSYVGPLCGADRSCATGESCLVVDETTSVCARLCQSKSAAGACGDAPWSCTRLSAIVQRPKEDAFVCTRPFFY